MESCTPSFFSILTLLNYSILTLLNYRCELFNGVMNRRKKENREEDDVLQAHLL